MPILIGPMPSNRSTEASLAREFAAVKITRIVPIKILRITNTSSLSDPLLRRRQNRIQQIDRAFDAFEFGIARATVVVETDGLKMVLAAEQQLDGCRGLLS